MLTSLVTPAGRLDRSAVMLEAHRQFRLMRPLGWSFGRCLSFAWGKARVLPKMAEPSTRRAAGASRRNIPRAA
jgi:hypothetical protein